MSRLSLPQYFKQLVAASPTTHDPYAGFGNPKALRHEGYQLSVRNTTHRSRGKPDVQHPVDVFHATLRGSRMDRHADATGRCHACALSGPKDCLGGNANAKIAATALGARRLAVDTG
jgi:hypothetical protein